MTALRIALSVVVATTAVAGCHRGPKIAHVQGTVTMDGEPLEAASIVFIPEVGGRPAGAWTDEHGKYELNFSGGRKGAIPGRNRVQIKTKADAYQDREGNLVPSRPETIPIRYNTQSELEFVVEEGKRNVADFQLESGGRVDRDVGL